MRALFVMFALSVFFPVYTYALYPMILKLLKGKEHQSGEVEPSVSVIVIGDDAEEKIRNVRQCVYPAVEIIAGDYADANDAAGEIVLFTDTETRLDRAAIEEIVKPFADERVGCVVGQQTNRAGNSAFWKYENHVKLLESRIGCVSGANESIFAVRKSDLPELCSGVLNKPFCIATGIIRNGKDVVFRDTAKAYEEKSEGTNFEKHVRDAAGYWQSLGLFPQMLLPRHGSFVFFSHRVMKWFVWLNMAVMLITSGMLALNGSVLMTVLFWMQAAGYGAALTFGRKSLNGTLAGRALGMGYYFIMLNAAYFAGLFYKGEAR